MRDEVKRDLGDSASDFLNIVWPAIADEVGGGELVPVETVTAEGFTSTLDALAGIDAWQVVQDSGLRGIASRVQWVLTAWNTFTVRCKRENGTRTEFEKRLKAISEESEGWLYPHLTTQAYLMKRGGPLLSVGVVETKLLIRKIEDNLFSEEGQRFRVSPTGEEFYYIHWDELKPHVQIIGPEGRRLVG